MNNSNQSSRHPHSPRGPFEIYERLKRIPLIAYIIAATLLLIYLANLLGAIEYFQLDKVPVYFGTLTDEKILELSVYALSFLAILAAVAFLLIKARRIPEAFKQILIQRAMPVLAVLLLVNVAVISNFLIRSGSQEFRRKLTLALLYHEDSPDWRISATAAEFALETLPDSIRPMLVKVPLRDSIESNTINRLLRDQPAAFISLLQTPTSFIDAIHEIDPLRELVFVSATSALSVNAKQGPQYGSITPSLSEEFELLTKTALSVRSDGLLVIHSTSSPFLDQLAALQSVCLNSGLTPFKVPLPELSEGEGLNDLLKSALRFSSVILLMPQRQAQIVADSLFRRKFEGTLLLHSHLVTTRMLKIARDNSEHVRFVGTKHHFSPESNELAKQIGSPPFPELVNTYLAVHLVAKAMLASTVGRDAHSTLNKLIFTEHRTGVPLIGLQRLTFTTEQQLVAPLFLWTPTGFGFLSTNMN